MKVKMEMRKYKSRLMVQKFTVTFLYKINIVVLCTVWCVMFSCVVQIVEVLECSIIDNPPNVFNHPLVWNFVCLLN